MIAPKNLSFAPSPETKGCSSLLFSTNSFFIQHEELSRHFPPSFFQCHRPEEYRILPEHHSSGTVMRSIPQRLQDYTIYYRQHFVCLPLTPSQSCTFASWGLDGGWGEVGSGRGMHRARAVLAHCLVPTNGPLSQSRSISLAHLWGEHTERVFRRMNKRC